MPLTARGSYLRHATYRGPEVWGTYGERSLNRGTGVRQVNIKR